MFIQVVESVEEPAMQYLHIAETEDPQGTETAVSALQDLRFNTQNGQKQLLNFLNSWYISVKFICKLIVCVQVLCLRQRETD